MGSSIGWFSYDYLSLACSEDRARIPEEKVDMEDEFYIRDYIGNESRGKLFKKDKDFLLSLSL